MKLLAYILIIYLYPFSSLYSKTIKIENLKGIIEYGIHETRYEACLAAEQELIKQARRKIGGGEIISGTDTSICKISNDEASCVLHTNTFHSLGKIAIIDINKKGKCEHKDMGNNIFQATWVADIKLKKLEEVSDNFNFRPLINKNEFTSYSSNDTKNNTKNEHLDITIEPMEDMYISVFQWLPYEDEKSVLKIFPNKIDTNNFFKAKEIHSIPTKNKLKSYRLRADFPENVFVPDVQEFILFIGTKNFVDFLDTYTFSEIEEIISNISESKKNQIRKNNIPYIITKK